VIRVRFSPKTTATALLGILGAILLVPQSIAQEAASPVNPSSDRLVSVSNRPIMGQLIFVNPILGDDAGDGGQRSPFRTISRALQMASTSPANSDTTPQPTIILLSPGTYSVETGETFPLIVPPHVTLQGDPASKGRGIMIRGGGTSSQITTGNPNVVLIASGTAGLTGVTVTNPNPDGYGLWIDAGSPTITSNTFNVASRQNGISVQGGGAPVMQGNTITERAIALSRAPVGRSTTPTTTTASPVPTQESVTASPSTIAEPASPAVQPPSLAPLSEIVLPDLTLPDLRPTLPTSATMPAPETPTAPVEPARVVESNPRAESIPENSPTVAVESSTAISLPPSFSINVATTANYPVIAFGERLTTQSDRLPPQSDRPASSTSTSSAHPLPQLAATAPAPVASPPPPASLTESPATRHPQRTRRDVEETTSSAPSESFASTPSRPATVEPAVEPAIEPTVEPEPVRDNHIQPERPNRRSQTESSLTQAATPNESLDVAVQPTRENTVREQSRTETIDLPIDLPIDPPRAEDSETSPLRRRRAEAATPDANQESNRTDRATRIAHSDRPRSQPEERPTQSQPDAGTTSTTIEPGGVEISVIPPAGAATIAPRSRTPENQNEPGVATEAVVDIPVTLPSDPVPQRSARRQPQPRPEPSATVSERPPSGQDNRTITVTASPIPSNSTSNSTSNPPPILRNTSTRNAAPSRDPSLLPVPNSEIPLGNTGGLPTVRLPRSAVISTLAQGSGPRPTANVQYRVVVEAESERIQEEVLWLVPGAFMTSINGRTMMQVGAYSDRSNAESIVEMLSRNGLRARIQAIE